MENRMFRSVDERMIGGVCGGLGTYLGIDPTFVRIFFVLLTIANGIGVMVYLLLWLILPQKGTVPSGDLEENLRAGADEIAERARELGTEFKSGNISSNPKTTLIIGGSLVLLGIFFLIDQLNIVWLSWLNFNSLWPVLLIVGGGAILYRQLRGE
jgi:phage shock protein C